MGDVIFTLNDIVWVMGFVLSLGALVALIKVLNKPTEDIKQKNHEQDDRLDDHDEKLKKDLNRFEDIEGTLRILCRSQLALIDHALTDNGMERMRAIRKELEDFLIDSR